jgi:hypothetical protein
LRHNDHDKVVAAYAAAELRGDVKRASNVHGITPEENAWRLYADGGREGVDSLMARSAHGRPSFDEVFNRVRSSGEASVTSSRGTEFSVIAVVARTAAGR